jgi:hypothetical protein
MPLVVRRVGGKGLRRHAARRAVRHLDDLDTHRPQLTAAAVKEPALCPHNGLSELIDIIRARRRVHPAHVFVEALVDKELPPCHRPIGVEAMVARHLQFRPKKERSVRIDEQQGMAVFRDRRRNRDAVGAAGFARLADYG